MITQHNTDAKISKLVKDSSGKRSWVDASQTVSLFLQPLGGNDRMMVEGDPAKSFKAYIPFWDGRVDQADRLEIEGEIYEVRSVSVYSFGCSPHCKIILEKAQ